MVSWAEKDAKETNAGLDSGIQIMVTVKGLKSGQLGFCFFFVLENVSSSFQKDLSVQTDGEFQSLKLWSHI